MASLADHLLPLEHRDCSLILVLPQSVEKGKGEQQQQEQQQQQQEQEQQHSERGTDARSPGPRKRLRLSPEAPECRCSLPANSAVLQLFSQKFRNWAARWVGEAGAAKEYVVRCRDEAEVGGYRLLLDFMHSMGKQLPTEPSELLQLLLLAREHSVEPAVLVCTQRLLEQAASLPSMVCMQLLLVLETGVTGDSSIQQAADRLAAACLDRLCALLGEAAGTGAAGAGVAGEGAEAGAGSAGVAFREADERQQLLELLGPLQEMLNDGMRRRVWSQLPFWLLKDCMLEDANVSADTEATVLAACLFWAEGRAADLAADQLAALFSRIRFPDVPAALLLNYHRCFATLQRFDPDRELLLRAITDPSLWRGLRDAMSAPDHPASIAALKQTCERWWLPRPRPLPGAAAPAEFQFQCGRPSGSFSCSDTFYWGGTYWRIQLKEKQGCAGVYLHPSVDHAAKCFPDSAAPSEAVYGVRVQYEIRLSRAQGSSSGDERQASGTYRLEPSQGWGRGSRVKDRCAAAAEGKGKGKAALSWEAFWGEGSPYCREGVVRGRFTLCQPGS